MTVQFHRYGQVVNETLNMYSPQDVERKEKDNKQTL